MTISLLSDQLDSGCHAESPRQPTVGSAPGWSDRLPDPRGPGGDETGISVLGNSSTECQESSDACCSGYPMLRLAAMLARIRQLDRAVEILDFSGDAEGACPALRIVKANLAACAGDFRGAFDLATSVAGDSDDTCLRTWAPLNHLVLALTALRLGNLSTAIRCVKLLEEDSVFRRQTFPWGQAAWVIVQVTEAEGGHGKALPLVAEMLAAPAVIRDLLVSQPAAVPWLVRFAGGAENPMASRAVRLARELAAENPGFRSVEAVALHCAGLYDDDIAQLRAAEETHTDRWAQASAAEDAAVLLGRCTSRFADAVGSLEHAMHRYLELGALRDYARVKSRLRELGAKQNPRKSGRPRSGIPSLTDTEYSVAKLVTQGFTNAQAADQLFLSRHTVAFHLRKIFRKIGVESRVQLALEWNSLDAGEDPS